MTTPVPTAVAGHGLVVVDVEGNGRQPPDIIEFAGLPVDETVNYDGMRSWLIRPPRSITPIVTKKVHGISNADVADCPWWSEVATEIAGLLGGRVLVAHNARVEYRTIGAHLPDWNPPMVLDTLRLAKHVWPELKSHGLDKLAAHANLDLTAVAAQQYHRATYDVWCAWKLLCALVEDGDLDWAGLIKAAVLPGAIAPSESEGLW